MHLHVILGPPGSGKTGRVMDHLHAAAGAGSDAFLVVPGAADRERYLRELAGRDAGAALGVEVGSFDALVTRVAGSPPVRRTDRAMERVVTRDALRRVGGELGRAAEWSGFVETARRHVDRLRRAAVWGGAELDRVHEDLPGGALEAWQRLAEVVEELLGERRLRDDAWFERRAARAVRRGAAGLDTVVVHGFDALPTNRVVLLEQLAAYVPVLVTMPWRPGRRVHERAGELRDRWRDRGAFLEELDGVAPLHPLIGWTADELYEESPAPRPQDRDPVDAPAPVRFVDCCGRVQETEETVREVALLAANGCGWSDIAVACANVAADAEQLLVAFDRAGIPARLQARRTAVDVPAGRALHGVLTAVDEARPLALVGALRAPLFDVDPARVDAAELALRRARVTRRDPLAHPALRAVLPAGVRALVDGAPAVAAMRELLAGLAPADTGELDLLRGVASALEGVVVAAGGEDGVGCSDLIDLVASFPLAVPDRTDAGAVVVASIDDLRSVTFDAVVLRGMHLAGFRAAVEVETDAPRAARDLLYLAVTRARRTLRVVRQAADAAGAPLAPSPGWSELRRLHPHAPLRTRSLAEVVAAPQDARLEHERAASAALALGRGARVGGVEPALQERIDAARRVPRPERVQGVVAEQLAATNRLAVTALETYATCSAKWFVDRWLRVASVDDDRRRVVEGNLAHELLRVLAPAARLGEQLDGEALHAAAVAEVDRLVSEVDPAGSLERTHVARVVANVVATLDAEAAWARPDEIHVERDIGGDTEQPIAPGLVVDGVELVGRVDRVDRHGGRVLLHDYKYSASPRPARSLVADRNLQLAVYWLALAAPGSPLEPIGAVYRSVTAAGAPSGIITDALRDHGVVGARAKTLDDDATDELLDAVRTVVTDAVTDLRTGVVRPLPLRSMCPTHCQLQAICRVEEHAG